MGVVKRNRGPAPFEFQLFGRCLCKNVPYKICLIQKPVCLDGFLKKRTQNPAKNQRVSQSYDLDLKKNMTTKFYGTGDLELMPTVAWLVRYKHDKPSAGKNKLCDRDLVE